MYQREMGATYVTDSRKQGLDEIAMAAKRFTQFGDTTVSI